MSFTITNFAGDHVYNDGRPRAMLDGEVVRELSAADGWPYSDHRAFLLRGAGHLDQALIRGLRCRFFAVRADGPDAGSAIYWEEPGSSLRMGLLSAQGYENDPTYGRRLTACHFFDPGQRRQVLPTALCGWKPADPTLAPGSYTTADYAPSKADCRDCQVVLGEEKPRRRR